MLSKIRMAYPKMVVEKHTSSERVSRILGRNVGDLGTRITIRKNSKISQKSDGLDVLSTDGALPDL